MYFTVYFLCQLGHLEGLYIQDFFHTFPLPATLFSYIFPYLKLWNIYLCIQSITGALGATSNASCISTHIQPISKWCPFSLQNSFRILPSLSQPHTIQYNLPSSRLSIDIPAFTLVFTWSPHYSQSKLQKFDHITTDVMASNCWGFRGSNCTVLY